MDIFDWIKVNLKPEVCTSDRFIYDDMDSQSGRSLPIIYQPFDLREKSHWQDRGALFDFLYSTRGEGKRLLDFGPGDGWPSLIVAPFVSEVVGVDGSHRRVDVCTENATRMGLANARFYYTAPGSPLPFEDDSFDGVMAASSVEQSPDPRRTLQELFRVIRPGGHLRITYEALNRYRNGQERDIWLCQTNDHQCRLILFDRTIDREVAVQYGITYDLSEEEFKRSSGKILLQIPLLFHLAVYQYLYWSGPEGRSSTLVCVRPSIRPEGHSPRGCRRSALRKSSPLIVGDGLLLGCLRLWLKDTDHSL